MGSIYDNLVDLKDHCFLCFREDRETMMRDNEMGEADIPEQEFVDVEGDDDELDGTCKANLCKRFLKSLVRYLTLPKAELMVVCENDGSPKRIQRRWENLITGIICGTCKEFVESFCVLYTQKQYIEMQLQVKMQELEQSIHFTDQDSSCVEGKSLLREKWESNQSDSQHLFQLMDILRREILSKTAKIEKLPMVSINRVSDSVKIDQNKTKILDHRQSLEDSGVSINSGLSPMSSCGEDSTSVMDDPISHDHTSHNNVAKEYKVMRRVFTCKRCQAKYFTKEKLTAHYKVEHPNSLQDSDTPTTLKTASDDLSPQRKEYKIKKTAFICRVKDCGQKFLRKEVMMEHMKTHPPHPQLAPLSICTDISTAQTNVHGEVAESVRRDSKDDESTASSHEYEPLPMSRPTENAPVPQTTPRKTRRSYSRRAFNCSFKDCTKKFHTERDLVFHALFHRSQQCFFCNEICKGPAALALHEYKRHHRKTGPSSTNDKTCPRCPYTSPIFTNYRRYRSHFYTNHLGVEVPEFTCSKCGTTTLSKRTLERHYQRCKTQSTQEVSSNVASVSPQEPPPSQTANSTDTTSQESRPTTSLVTNKYTCNICSLPCNSFTAYQTHLIARHDPNILFCNDCERMFKDSDALHKHRAYIHLKFKVCVKYCKYCKREITFKSIIKFNAHMKQHENQRNNGPGPDQQNQPRSLRPRKLHKLRARQRVQTKRRAREVDEDRDDNESGRSSPSEGSERRVALYDHEPMESDDDGPRNLADRVKMGLRRKSVLNYTENLDEEARTKKNLKQKRMRRHGIKNKTSNGTEGYNDPDEVFTDKACDKTQVIASETRSTEPKTQPTAPESQFTTRVTDSQRQVGVKEETRSPIKRVAPPPPRISDIGNSDDSCDSSDTVILENVFKRGNNHSTNVPDMISDNRSEFSETIKVTPTTSNNALDSPQIGVMMNDRFQKWMVTNNAPIASTSKQSFQLGAQENVGKIADCIDLVDDDSEKDNLEKKPDPSTVELSKRVTSWLSDRETGYIIGPPPTPTLDTSDVEIITLD